LTLLTWSAGDARQTNRPRIPLGADLSAVSHNSIERFVSGPNLDDTGGWVIHNPKFEVAPTVGSGCKAPLQIDLSSGHSHLPDDPQAALDDAGSRNLDLGACDVRVQHARHEQQKLRLAANERSPSPSRH